jgi:hypothetical protein
MPLTLARVAVLYCLAVSSLAAQAPPAERLGRSRTIYVARGAERDDLADLVKTALSNFGRWTVVETPEQADLVARVGGKGSNRKGTVWLTIADNRDGRTLWHSEDTGRAWHQSGFVRALNVIIERLEETSLRWPAYASDPVSVRAPVQPKG